MAKRKHKKAAASGMKYGRKGKDKRGAEIDPKEAARLKKEHYLFSMSHAGLPDRSVGGLQLLPAAVFTAVVILIVRQYRYKRDMSVYYWSSDRTELTEFFSHYKVMLIEIATIAALVFLLYRIVTQSFAVKRSVCYIPMAVYLFLTLLSWALSEHRDVAWSGWNDRFEGTAVIICYMLMLFYLINSVNSEHNLKCILYPVTGVTILLSLLGVSQATDHDFLRTAPGLKLLVPNKKLPDGSMPWDQIDQAKEAGEEYLRFEFQNREIYQTVYNINYVSFYLTLLLPIFGLLFIREKRLAKKILWGAIFTLLVFNLIGSASSGGLLGCAVVVVVAVILLNKRLLHWWKSVAVLVALTLIVGGVTLDRWGPELRGAVRSVIGAGTEQNAQPQASGKPGASGHRLDYFITDDRGLTFSLDGNVATIAATPDGVMTATDAGGNSLPWSQSDASGMVSFQDASFRDVRIAPSRSEGGKEMLIFSLQNEERQWKFLVDGERPGNLIFQNDMGKSVELANIPHFGFQNNPGFGSGRGYIWSVSLPMLRDTVLVGKGADTFAIYFPHNDYVGKYNAGWSVNMIVDKPHNMYIGIAFNTGVLSLIALLILFGGYLVGSFRLYRKETFDTFASYAGAGIFLGVCGFLVSGVVNDSTVSVMPMFYGLLGTGIATNMIVRRAAQVRTGQTTAVRSV
ncbi:MAG: O-antigen ligase family protein [Clostridiales Family XIII bacterium]|jgi:O-antigen ligase|nr:O-antigen ligase family protein [Clostridiales Family XIII bacterium]